MMRTFNAEFDRSRGYENPSSALAQFLPLIVIVPTAVAVIWIQVSQVLQITFSTASYISVSLFIAGFLLTLLWAARSVSLRVFTEDYSWIALAGLCLIFSFLAFVLVRWDGDDTHYLPNAVYFLANPNTKMGFEAYYIHFDGEPFRALSWINSYSGEYLLASFTHVLGFDFLSMYWSGKTLLAAFLIPCAWYGLLERFGVPHLTILAAIIITFLVVMILGDSFGAYGHWFITWFFHCKAIVVTLGLPLIWSHTLSFLDRQTRESWFALFTISSAMMGLSTMSGFLIPVSTGMLVLAYCITNKVKIWSDMKRFLGLGSAFSYLLAATLFIRINVNPIILQNDSIVNGHYPTTYLGQLAFVTNISFPLSITIIILATIVCLRFSSGKSQQLIAWWCGLYAIVLLNPLFADFLMEKVTTSNTYYRLFHGYPVPLVIGLSAAFFFTYVTSLKRIQQFVALGVACILLAIPHALLVMQIAFGWERTAPTIIRGIHRVSFGGPRVSEVRIKDIRALLQRLPKGAVLAAHPANSNIPIFSAHHPQIYARQIETEYWFLTRGDPERGRRRYRAMRFASGESPKDIKSFFRVIKEEPNLKSLVLNPDALKSKGVVAEITALGFKDSGKAGRYRLFIRE